MNIIRGVPQEECSKHGEGCRCSPGIVDTELQLWAQCGDERHGDVVDRVTLVCCDNGHEFLFPPVADGREQTGHVWTDGPRCIAHCPNHGSRRQGL